MPNLAIEFIFLLIIFILKGEQTVCPLYVFFQINFILKGKPVRATDRGGIAEQEVPARGIGPLAAQGALGTIWELDPTASG